MLCGTALQHATRLQPFASYLQADRQLQAIVLSLIAGVPQTTETASSLTELSLDAESFEAETRHKLQLILKDRQRLPLNGEHRPGPGKDTDVISSSRLHGRTLYETHYEKVCEHERQTEMKRQVFDAYHEKLFIADDVDTEDLLVDSQPFESCEDFLVCLDTFYSVSFGSCVELDCADSLPLIDAFASEVRRAQLERVPAKPRRKPEFTRSVSFQSSLGKATVTRKLDVVESTVCLEPPVSKRGAFHSHSISETDLNVCQKSPAILQRVPSGPAEIDISLSKGGLDVTDLTTLHSSSKGIQHTQSVSAAGLPASEDCFGRTRHNASVCCSGSMSHSGCSRSAVVNCLSESVLPPATVGRLKFDGEIAETERLAEWLNGWAVRHCEPGNVNRVRSSALRVRVSPQLVAYSLWLIDSCEHFTPRVGDVTVAMVHGQMAASVPPRQERSYYSTLVNSASARDEHVSPQRDRRSSRGTASSATGQEVPADYVTRGKEGDRTEKVARRAEVASGVGRQTGSQDIQASSSLQELTEPVNRSANNNIDRCE